MRGIASTVFCPRKDARSPVPTGTNHPVRVFSRLTAGNLASVAYAEKERKTDRRKIPDDTWRALCEAADALGELQLWQLMGDAELLGVDDPHTGEPVLGAVMGRLGEVFGIAIHHGPAGLRWILELATSDEPELDMDAFLAVAVLKVEFVKKAELPAEDKRRVKALGFTPRGGMRARWPLFESKRPDHMPGPIHAEDARLLLHALPRLTALGAAVMPILERTIRFPRTDSHSGPQAKRPMSRCAPRTSSGAM